MFSEAVLQDAEALLAICRQKKLTLATAESCTGGLVAALLTEIPGSSDVFQGGAVAYANNAKLELANVKSSTIALFGAVSGQASNEMARGIAKRLKADLAVSITGIAGPGGGTELKPVGTVHFSVAAAGALEHTECHFEGDRKAVRMQAVTEAISLLTAAAKAL